MMSCWLRRSHLFFRSVSFVSILLFTRSRRPIAGFTFSLFFFKFAVLWGRFSDRFWCRLFTTLTSASRVPKIYQYLYSRVVTEQNCTYSFFLNFFNQGSEWFCTTIRTWWLPATSKSSSQFLPGVGCIFGLLVGRAGVCGSFFLIACRRSFFLLCGFFLHFATDLVKLMLF